MCKQDELYGQPQSVIIGDLYEICDVIEMSEGKIMLQVLNRKSSDDLPINIGNKYKNIPIFQSSLLFYTVSEMREMKLNEILK